MLGEEEAFTLQLLTWTRAAIRALYTGKTYIATQDLTSVFLIKVGKLKARAASIII